MWRTVCQNCEWESGEAYSQSVAETIGRLHEEDHAGHKVVMKHLTTFGSDLEGTVNSEPKGLGSTKS